MQHIGKVASVEMAGQCTSTTPGSTMRGLLPCRPQIRHQPLIKRSLQDQTPRSVVSKAFRDFLGLGRQSSTATVSKGSQASMPEGPKAARLEAKRDFLEARQVSLFQLFDGREFMFDIPYYQRPYSWGVKQVHEMLQDFLAAYYAQKEYFLGAFITVRAEDGCLQVIDGQQRLTTLVLLLACVHDWARASKNGVLEQRLRHMLYIEADPLDPNSQGRLRLRLRDGDDDFFERNMMKSFLPTRFRYTGVGTLVHPSNGNSREGGLAGNGAGSHSHSQQLYASGAGQMMFTAAATAKASGLAGVHHQTPIQLDLPAAGQSAWADMSAQQQRNQQQQGQQQQQQQQAAADDSQWRPLENESWYRMYQNSGHILALLRPAVASGNLNLQDLLFHVLRNCHCVLMTARDEATSMRIFSTINSRGMDLTMVDKLKADLLEVLPHEQCVALAAAWAEMEDVLGRSAFHRVFDYMRALACAMRPEVQHLSVLEYFGAQRRDPKLAAATIQCALHYARLLLQLRQCRFQLYQQAAARPARPPISTSKQALANIAKGARQQLLSDDGQGGIITQYDAGGPDSQVHTCGAVRELERQARHMALFDDESWLPATLEFFAQVDDLDARTRFLQGAEVLQLYLELCSDPAAAAARWRQVAAVVLQQKVGSGNSNGNGNGNGTDTGNGAAAAQRQPMTDLPTVYAALSLTPQEKYAFRMKLDQRDLLMFAPRRSLAHLLLRAEGTAVSTSPAIDFSSLHIEQITPPHPPKDSAWRRQKLGSPGCSSPGRASSVEMDASDTGSSSSPNRNSASSNGTPTAGSGPTQTAAERGRSASLSSGSSRARRQSPSSSSNGTGSDSGGIKYWYEPQRLQWHSKLGNLILLPNSTTSQKAVANADFETKVAYYRSCNVEKLLPEWSGSVVSGAYSRHKFSCEECKQRHEGLLRQLIQVFKLADNEDFDMWEEDDEEPEYRDSVY